MLAVLLLCCSGTLRAAAQAAEVPAAPIPRKAPADAPPAAPAPDARASGVAAVPPSEASSAQGPAPAAHLATPAKPTEPAPPRMAEAQARGGRDRALRGESGPPAHDAHTAGLHPTLFWIGAGATAVTAAVGGLFALRAVALQEDALALPAVHPDRTQRRGDVEDAEITADIFFASAALLAAGTTIVLLVTDWDARADADTDVEPLDREVHFSPAVGPDSAGLIIGGRL